ncbi:hypothetical protein [Sporomusa ovata]|nr:hypothetical protein [Sporomusa ovata]
MKSLWTTLESMGIYPGEQVTINVGKSDSSCSDKTSNERIRMLIIPTII